MNKQNKFKDCKVDKNILKQAAIKCVNILKSKKIVSVKLSSEEREAYFVLLIVLLNALVTHLRKDYFYLKNNYPDLQDCENIEGLIREIRNACCHIDSGNNYTEQNVFYRFTTKLGTDGKYPDDATIYFGKRYILYWRHIVCITQEICVFLNVPFNLNDTFIELPRSGISLLVRKQA